MTHPTIVMRAQHLRKTFRIGFLRKRIEAVLDATFEVHEGEIFGLIGPNGAGKTTTLKMMMGLISPDAGSGEILGHNIRSVEARRHVGFLPEHPSFYDSLKPMELMSFYADLYEVDAVTRRTRIPKLLEQVGLGDALDKPLRKFSKGMLQRIGLAQALLPDSRLVLLDEPQSGLDPMGRKDVRDLIVSLRDAGKTVVFSSHVLPDVEQIADRVAMIIRGRVVQTGPLHDLVDPNAVEIELVLQPPVADFAWPDDCPPARIAADGNAHVRTTDPALADEVLRRVITGGGRIVEVHRHRPHLEDVFLKAVADVEAARKGAA